jgi:5'-nucleotidase
LASPLSPHHFPANLSYEDFGYAHLSTLIKSCNFPWLLSNIVDTDTGRQPDAVQRFVVFEKMGVRVGVVGLVEKDWIATIRA